MARHITEVKRTVDGRELRFPCTLLARTDDWVAIRYVLSEAATVGALVVPPGSVTIGHYWPRRPYTAYHWLDPSGQTLGVYLNAATGVRIDTDTVFWQDLALDVLVTAAGGVEVLDDEEARAAPAWAQAAIDEARTHLLVHAAAIASEVRTLSSQAQDLPPGGQRTSG